MHYAVFRTWRLPWRFLAVLLLVLALGIAGYNCLGGETVASTRDVMSWAITGRVVVIDPGHGGRDPGAVGQGGTREKDVTLAISQKLADVLRQAGAEAILTREGDYDLAQPGSGSHKQRDLDQRLAVVRQNHADVYLSIQVNAMASSRWSGSQTFYYGGNEKGEALAKAVQGEIKRIVANTRRMAKEQNTTYMLKQLQDLPAAMVEVGFISNTEEERLLRDPAYQERLAKAISNGVILYFAEMISRDQE